MDKRISVLQGDITQSEVDAIVNAANTSLLGGGGVDGAIHRAAGPELLEECRGLDRCPAGEARITRGYNLPAKWVIHTVGPVWRGGGNGEPVLLAACYQNSLKLAFQNGIKSIAFPSISTGAYRYPLTLAAPIALHTISDFLRENQSFSMVQIVCFSSQVLKGYNQAAADLFGT